MGELVFEDFSLTLPGTLRLISLRTAAGEHEITGALDGPLDPRLPSSQLEAAGFDNLDVHGSANAFSLTAVRDGTTVYMTFSGPPQAIVYLSVSIPAEHAALPVVEGYFTWAGVRWPAHFSDGKLACTRSDDDVYITARVPPEEDVVERYRVWALRAGFEVEAPINSWEDEPDLRIARGLRFRDRHYLARLELDGELVTLFITRRPGT